MASIAMMVGGAVVNALAFSGSNYLFSKLRNNNSADEIKRHNAAMEELTKARDTWNKKRIQRIDYINDQLKKQSHALKTYSDVNLAMKEYAVRFGKQLPPLEPEPVLEDFYVKSDEQEKNEILFVTLGMGIIVGVAYWHTKN